MSDCSEHKPTKYITIVVVVTLLLSASVPLFDALNSLGFMAKKSYLLILQDNMEIRHTGGFMRVICLLDVDRGTIQNLQFYDVTEPPMNVNVTLDGPEGVIKAFNTSLFKFMDMNMQYDFPTFVPVMESTFRNLTGHSVDGTIAIDLTVIEQFLKITGPLTVYNEVVTSRNVVDRLHYYSEVVNEGSEWMNFLSEFVHQVITIINTSNYMLKLQLLNNFQRLAEQKHISIRVRDGFLLKDYDGAIKKQSGDYLYIVEANLVGKGSFSIDRTINYQVELLSDGSALSSLTLTYTNNCYWTCGILSTTLTPEGATLLSSNAPGLNAPLVTNYTNLSAFSSKIWMRPNQTIDLNYVYQIPHIISRSGLISHYDLYVQKQPGIDHYALNVGIALPAETKLIRSEHIGNNVGLTEDLHVSALYMST